MFEKRSIWGLILGLNVCILIWLISVQEPVIFEGETPVAAASTFQQHNSNGWGRDLLSKHTLTQSNEYPEDMSAAASNLTTFYFSNNHNNNSNNINSSTAISKQITFDVKTTTKTSDLSSDIQQLTSSLGTGVLDLKTKPTTSWAKQTATGLAALPEKDFNQLIDLQNFQFLISQPVCGYHIEALILIHSAPKNHKKRHVIRETWASICGHSTESPLLVLFLIGAVSNEQVQDDLRQENNIHRDLVQGSFVDDYRNMTYKHIMAFKWYIYNCPQAQILIKVDDDVYVNTPQLIKYLNEQQQTQQNESNNNTNSDTSPTIDTTVTPNKTTANTNITITSSTIIKSSSILHKLNFFAAATPTTLVRSSVPVFNASEELFNHPRNLLFCQKIIGSLVKRSYRSKWRVSFKEYSERYYPPYCPGYAIIYSPDIIFRLYTAAQNSKYFWIDDVHITGVLAQQTNTTITTSSHYVLFSDECDEILTGKTDLSKTEFLFAWHSISAQKIKSLWHLQMMNVQTLDNQQQSDQKQRTRNGNEYILNNVISSAYTYTSMNGFR